MTTKPFVVSWMVLLNMPDAFISNNHLVRNDIIGYTLIFLNIQPCYMVHSNFPTNVFSFFHYSIYLPFFNSFLSRSPVFGNSVHDIQEFYNSRVEAGLSPKTVKNIHGVLHKALQQAMLNGITRNNPSDACVLPRIQKKTISPLNEEQITLFIKVIKGHRYEKMSLTALFTGIREGEVCGLQWECVDFDNGKILIDKQLQSLRKGVRGEHEKYALVPTKNSKGRTITAAPFVMDVLKEVKQEQASNQEQFRDLFQDSGFVFTDEIGNRVTPQALYRAFKLVVCEMGMPDVRFHDLRHSYAVASIRAGDDIKTVQENLGHATAAFTLDVYGHVTEKMKKESADRMQLFIQSVNQ